MKFRSLFQKRSIRTMLAGAVGLVLLSGCATAPVTGRSQLLLVSEGQEIALGVQAYTQFLSEVKLSQNQEITTMVNRVGMKIAQAANKPAYNWEFTVVDDDKTVNAFALPGGKIVVYTGILPYTKDEAGMAFLIGHEVAHVIARHGGERMSQALLVQLGEESLRIALANKSPETIQAISMGYGLATTVGVMLPFSRTHEYEADRIGLILMAKAGYDPNAAPAFFERMLEDSSKKAPPEFLSTHPADASRIRELYALIPEALQYYDK